VDKPPACVTRTADSLRNAADSPKNAEVTGETSDVRIEMIDLIILSELI
jgi:hypothetical protein